MSDQQLVVGKIEQLTTEPPAVGLSAVERLVSTPDFKGFADDILHIVWDGGDIGGDVVQELAESRGLIKETVMQEPCGENCTCAEVTDFPATCFRKAY